ncbi:MAG: metallophosphoesterase [Candidatus Bathyarchaeia archaeon]
MYLYPLIPFPALVLEGERRILVIADLHIGWEVSLSQQGIHIPSQIGRLTSKALKALELSKADELLILGDVKHTVARAELEEWRDVPLFFEEVQGMVESISVIPGNHDGNLEGLLPADVKLHPSTGAIIGDTALFHGHSLPSPKILKGCNRLVMGHMHPVIALRDKMGFKTLQQVWVKTRCEAAELLKILRRRRRNVEDLKLEEWISCTILPSFNDLLGGRAVNSSRGDGEYMGPLMRAGIINLDESEAFLLDGTYLGRIQQLRSQT